MLPVLVWQWVTKSANNVIGASLIDRENEVYVE